MWPWNPTLTFHWEYAYEIILKFSEACKSYCGFKIRTGRHNKPPTHTRTVRLPYDFHTGHTMSIGPTPNIPKWPTNQKMTAIYIHSSVLQYKCFKDLYIHHIYYRSWTSVGLAIGGTVAFLILFVILLVIILHIKECYRQRQRKQGVALPQQCRRSPYLIDVVNGCRHFCPSIINVSKRIKFNKLQ